MACHTCRKTVTPVLLACQACHTYNCSDCLTQQGSSLLVCPSCHTHLPILSFQSVLQNVTCKDLIAAFADQLQNVADVAHAFACPQCTARVHLQPGTSAALQCPACGTHTCIWCQRAHETERENHTHVCACPANPNTGHAHIYHSDQLNALRHAHVKKAVLGFFSHKVRSGNARLVHSVKVRARAYLRNEFGFDLSKSIMREATTKKH